MDAVAFAAELDRFGPASNDQTLSLRDAETYCRQLARNHYENFSVASGLLPKHLRQHFHNVYAYCRWADDLSDEIIGETESIELLQWWRQQLADCYDGRVGHPVFVALSKTIAEFGIPRSLFSALLDACDRDQRQPRYATFEELLRYCRCSADPVGHIVLYLGRCYDNETAHLSDSICTGLQLTNFLQDVANDYERGRIYLPQTSWQRFRYDERDFEKHIYDDRWCSMIAHECSRAGEFLESGWPLIERASRELRFQVELFLRGGFAVLKAIERAKYDVWNRRPIVSRLTKMSIVTRTWLSQQKPVTFAGRKCDAHTRAKNQG